MWCSRVQAELSWTCRPLYNLHRAMLEHREAMHNIISLESVSSYEINMRRVSVLIIVSSEALSSKTDPHPRFWNNVIKLPANTFSTPAY